MPRIQYSPRVDAVSCWQRRFITVGHLHEEAPSWGEEPAVIRIQCRNRLEEWHRGWLEADKVARESIPRRRPWWKLW